MIQNLLENFQINRYRTHFGVKQLTQYASFFRTYEYFRKSSANDDELIEMCTNCNRTQFMPQGTKERVNGSRANTLVVMTVCNQIEATVVAINFMEKSSAVISFSNWLKFLH